MEIVTLEKYVVVIAGKEVEFKTKAEAVAALAKVKLAGKAQKYVDSLRDKEGNPLADKDKKGKFNVVLDFLAFEAAEEAKAAEEAAAPASESTEDVNL